MAGRKTNLPIPDDCPMELRCKRCGATKPREEFPRNVATKTTFSERCTPCNAIVALQTRFRKDLETGGPQAYCEAMARAIDLLAIRNAVLAEYLQDHETESE